MINTERITDEHYRLDCKYMLFYGFYFSEFYFTRHIKTTRRNSYSVFTHCLFLFRTLTGSVDDRLPPTRFVWFKKPSFKTIFETPFQF